MYQVPVQKLEKIRTSRKRVKTILTDIGLDSCQNLLKELKQFDAGKECFQNTEWYDMTDGYKFKKRKKCCYRTQNICCSLCWFSTHSWQTYRNHVQRLHEEEADLASLSPCPRCPYISRPDLTIRHAKLFHSQTLSFSTTTIKTHSQVGVRVSKPGTAGDKFSCVRCGFHDSLLYVMRKHVLVHHCNSLLQRYYGQHSADKMVPDKPGSNDNSANVTKQSEFYCCVCKMPAETSEHLLYHLLSSDRHQELNAHISPLLIEHCTSNAKSHPAFSKNPAQVSQLAPCTLQHVMSLVSKGELTLPPPNGKPLTPKGGADLLAPPPQPPALVCSASGGRQILLANQKAAVATPALLGPSPSAGTPIGLMLPSGVQPKQLPLTVTMPGHSQPQSPQLLLPPGVTLNLGGKLGATGAHGQSLVLTQGQTGKIQLKVNQSRPVPVILAQGHNRAPNQTLMVNGKVSSSQPVMLTQALPLQSQAPRGPLMSSHSAVRLVPTGNKVNGVPTYTLATLQLAVPVQPGVSSAALHKPPVLVTVPQQTQTAQPAMGQNTTILPKTTAASASQKGSARSLIAKSLYLVMTPAGKVRCARCKSLVYDQAVLPHLLHGLQCIFCFQVFYSLKPLLLHSEQEHSLAEVKHREWVEREHQLTTTQDGRLVVQTFKMQCIVPRDTMGCRELHLAIVPEFNDKKVVHLHLTEKPVKPQTPSLPFSGCPLCSHKPSNPSGYEQHLRQCHHIIPTIHAILKTPAFKCRYCLGVYTDKSTTSTISIHVQKCRCAPTSVKEAERLRDPERHCPNRAVRRAREGQALSRLVKKLPTTADLEVPAGLSLKPVKERRSFLCHYFNRNPYPTSKEMGILATRLKLNRPGVTSLFRNNQKRCLQDCKRRRIKIPLGFDSSQFKLHKHSLDLPGKEPRSSDHAGLEAKQTIASECKQGPAAAVEHGPQTDHIYAGANGLGCLPGPEGESKAQRGWQHSKRLNQIPIAELSSSILSRTQRVSKTV